jgi:pimeloyl-ACP methyl ester carboxylesterase
MPIAEINGLSIHYQQAGQGRDLILIHGLLANLAFWYLGVLPELLPDFRVTVYDLRGHGYSSMPPQGYTSLHLATDLQALLVHLGIKRAHVVGHSFGGAVALHFATLQPEQVLSLTLADAHVPSFQPALPPLDAPRWRARKARLRRAGFDVPEDMPRVAYPFLEELVRLRRQWRNRTTPWGVESLLSTWKSSSRTMQRWTELMRATSAPTDVHETAGLSPEQLAKIEQPSLAIYGELSDCLPTLRGLVSTLPNCLQVIVPGVGHFHPVLRPALFAKKLRYFVQLVE